MGLVPLELVRGEANKDLAAFLRARTATDPGDSGSAVPSTARVGDFGEPERLIFDGVKTFTSEALRKGLLRRPEFLLASHPFAPLQDYLTMIQKMVLTGYQSNGFPDAQVTVRFDRNTREIVVEVTEGPRYLAGGVLVAGAETIPVDALTRRLTQPFPGDVATVSMPSLDEPLARTKYLDSTGREVVPQEPIWKKGEPVSFAEPSRKWLAARIAGSFHDFGFFFPKVEVDVVPDRESGTAELLVEILDEGPKGIIDAIDVTGNEKNTREEILTT